VGGTWQTDMLSWHSVMGGFRNFHVWPQKKILKEISPVSSDQDWYKASFFSTFFFWILEYFPYFGKTVRSPRALSRSCTTPTFRDTVKHDHEPRETRCQECADEGQQQITRSTDITLLSQVFTYFSICAIVFRLLFEKKNCCLCVQVTCEPIERC
jgi:hypothetical protein